MALLTMDTATTEAAATERKHLAVDGLTVIYLLASGLYLALHPNLEADLHPAPLPRALLHVVIAAAVWYLAPLLRRSPVRIVAVVGEIYPPLLFPFFYSEMYFLVGLFFPFDAPLDPWFIALEEQLLGFQPSLAWSEAMPWPWLHEIMEAAYFSYYFLALGAVILILRGRGLVREARRPALRALVIDLTATMLVCYTLYTFLPVWGPKYFTVEPIPVGGWIFTSIMHHIHASGAALGAAFPSSHVAASMIPWWHVWKHFPRHRAWMTVVFALLCASTVYCRYHYVVDVIGGLALGAFMLWLGGRVRRRGDAPPQLDT